MASPVERYGARVSLLAVAVALVGIPFGLLVEQVLSDGPLTRLDLAAARRVHLLVVDRPWALTTLRALSFCGRPAALAVVIGVPVVWLAFNGRRRLIAFLVVTAVGGGFIDSVVKIVVGRTRPELDHPVAHAMGKSFPSGHAMSSLVCYGAVVLVLLPLVPRRGRPLVVAAVGLLVLAIGVSRLGLGVHFLSDVVGGYVLGAAWLIASVAAFEIWREERGRRRTVPLSEGVEPEVAAPG